VTAARTVRAAAALAAALTAGALPPAATAEESVVSLQTPSHAIGCEYRHFTGETAGLRCDVAGMADRPARPASCELDYGSAFGLTPTGKGRRLCVGDTVRSPQAKVLAYGATRRLGPFTCVSRTSGLRCGTAAGHGFVLSRAHQKLF
jgi:hypothetical protein